MKQYAKWSLMVVALLVLLSSLQAQNRSYKRGVSFNNLSTADMEALSPGVSWMYNWTIQPSLQIRDEYEEHNMEFIPMTWNGWYNETQLRKFISEHASIKYLLAFNEPNFPNEANMTPREAAAAWPQLEAIAKDFGLKIVSPAVNYSPGMNRVGEKDYKDPVEWLDDFFAACPDCQVDYIGAHFYMGDTNGLNAAIERLYKYDRPIWLTEFNMNSGNSNGTMDDQIRFMTDAVAYLEKNPMIYRYCWFMMRNTWLPAISLFEGESSTLSELGDIYVNMSSFNTEYYYPTETIVPAAQYIDSKGVVLEQTDDVQGHLSLKNFGEYAYADYQVDVPNAGEYNLHLRIACNKSTKIEVYTGEVLINTFEPESTGGVTEWGDVSLPLTLPAGKQTLRIRSMGRVFRLNRLKISTGQVNGIETTQAASPVIRAEAYTLSGQLMNTGLYTNITKNLPKGIYILRLYHADGNFSQEKKYVN